jgi:AICAR transformylase/IMP cyclohydrolase PurH
MRKWFKVNILRKGETKREIAIMDLKTETVIKTCDKKEITVNDVAEITKFPETKSKKK